MRHVVVEDIIFQVLANGVIGPLAKINEDGIVSDFKLPNIHAVMKIGILVGDTIEIPATANRPIAVVKGLRPVDAYPPELPERCPNCGQSLSIEYALKPILRCSNKNCE